jgi:hypothetical protein
MTLEQLMAFTVTNDHARQEQVWESLARAYNKEPYYIRRQLTEGAVRAADKRARFVGVDTYEAAGGVVLRDLFQHDDGGWLQDPALLDRLVIEKLQAEAETLRAEGWKWIAVAPDFPYGHTAGLRRLSGETVDLTDEERASHDALRAEYDRLEEEYAQADELPDEADQRLGEIETALAAFEARAIVYDPTEIARAGVFVSIDADGDLRIERGYVRPEDEAPAEPVEGSDGDAPAAGQPNGAIQRTVITVGSGGSSEPEPEGDDDDGLKPLSERLITELTAHRTLALRDALANDPSTAFVAVLYTLCLGAFYRMSSATCLEISAKSTTFNAQAPGLADSASVAFDAGFDRLIRYWTEPKVQVGSRTESIKPKCIQRPHPPVYVATYREESAVWIGQRGLALFQGSQQSVDSIRRCIGAFTDAGGDVAQVPIGRFVVVGETDEDARQVAWPAAERLTGGYRRNGEQVRRRISTEEELETDRWLREVAIVGSPYTVAERITALHAEFGFGNFMLVPGFLGNLPQDQVARTLELFAKEVRPRVQQTVEPAGGG